MKKALVAIIIFALIGSLVAGLQSVEVAEAQSRTIVVPTDYPTIQEAIEAASNGDAIFVKKGIYNETPKVYKDITLIGEDRDTTIINATSEIEVKGLNVSITNFTIGNGGYGEIVLFRGYSNVTNNRLSDLTLYNSNNNYLAKNILNYTGGGILLTYSHNNMIVGNYIHSSEGVRIWSGSTNNTFTENTVTSCREIAIRLYSANNNTITRNNITYSAMGIGIYLSNANTISYNNFIGNTAQLVAGEHYALTFGANVSINNINKNYWSDYNGTDADGDGIGDTPQILYTDEELYSHNKDNNPLMEPIDFTNTSPNSTPSPIPTPTLTSSPSSTPTLSPSSVSPTATVPEFPTWIVLPLFVIGVALLALVYRKRT